MLRLFRKKLPHCDKLFKEYLSPWYPTEDKPEMTRPDMYIIAGYEEQPLDLDELQYLPEELLQEVKNSIAIITDAALQDYQNIIEADRLSLEVLDKVDRYYDKAAVAQIIKESDPKDYSNQYLVSVCEFGATLGYLFNQSSEFGWLYSYPYFHSIIVHKETGFGITVFDWAVKKFSEYGIEDGFVAKFHAAINGIEDHQKEKNIGA
ncbi:hypothetical protein [Pontibacter virosus]|uniref:Uncharacterized protein n=1 Tax=Pontibacter virosus TaxID=1765052 RepID=A0A2U1AWY7_9BACT|nr:hypothetical protein [Pontibacter virosus]PVY40946.1 hypothetical protein C8E01_106288 [Pontibacter virosus]